MVRPAAVMERARTLSAIGVPGLSFLVGEQDGRARVGGVRERMPRHRAAVVLEHLRAETVEGQRLQGIRSDTPTDWPGLMPQVTRGSIASASISTTSS